MFFVKMIFFTAELTHDLCFSVLFYYFRQIFFSYAYQDLLESFFATVAMPPHFLKFQGFDCEILGK